MKCEYVIEKLPSWVQCKYLFVIILIAEVLL